MSKQLSLKLLDERYYRIQEIMEQILKEIYRINGGPLGIIYSEKEYESAYPKRHYQEWEKCEDKSLYHNFEKFCINEAKIHQRTPRAIAWRFKDKNFIPNAINKLED